MSGQIATSTPPIPRSSEPAPAEVCPHFHAAIELIGKRWSGAILWAVSARPMRFGEIKKTVPGISDRLLSRRLCELGESGLIRREVTDGTPVKVTYSLTEKGDALRPAIESLREWACEWQEAGEHSG